MQETPSSTEAHKNGTNTLLKTDSPDDLETRETTKALRKDSTTLDDHTSSISSTLHGASQAFSFTTESLKERTDTTAPLGNEASSNTASAPKSSSLLTTEGSRERTSETASVSQSSHASSSGTEGLEKRTNGTEASPTETLSSTYSTPGLSFQASPTTTGNELLSSTTTTLATTSDPSSTSDTYSRTSTKVLTETSTADVVSNQISAGFSSTTLRATASTYSSVQEASTSSEYTSSENVSSTTSSYTLSMPTESYTSTPERDLNITETATESHTKSVLATISKSSTAEITTEETNFSGPLYLESTTIHFPPTPSDEFPIALAGIIFLVVAVLVIVTAFIWKTKKADGGKGARKFAKKSERNLPPSKSQGSKTSTSKKKQERRKSTRGKASPETSSGVTKEKPPNQGKKAEHLDQLKNEPQHEGKEAATKPSQGVDQDKQKALAVKQLAAPDIFPFTVAELERQQVNEFNMYIDKLTAKKTNSGSMMSTVI